MRIFSPHANADAGSAQTPVSSSLESEASQRRSSKNSAIPEDALTSAVDSPGSIGALRALLCDPNAVRYQQTRAILKLGEDPVGREILVDVLSGAFPGVATREREKAARVLHRADPHGFLAFVSGQPTDSPVRLIATRALVDITQSELKLLASSVTIESDELSVTALRALQGAGELRNEPFPFTTTCAEATMKLLNYARDRKLSHRQVSDNSPTVDLDPDAERFPVVSTGELRGTLKEAVSVLSNGLDGVLAAAVRRSKSPEAISLALEILHERKSPELSPLVADVVRAGGKSAEALEVLADLKIAPAGIEEGVRASLARDPWQRFANFLESVRIPVPSFLSPEQRSRTAQALVTLREHLEERAVERLFLGR